MTRLQRSFLLNKEKDKDIIEFLKDRPVSFTVREALRLYMLKEKSGITIHQESQQEYESVDNDTPASNFFNNLK